MPYICIIGYNKLPAFSRHLKNNSQFIFSLEFTQAAINHILDLAIFPIIAD